MARDYKQLIAFQKANALALEVYQATQGFPKSETFVITSQLRRAALSVPTNIVEGSHRHGRGDYLRFLDIALGSSAETGYLIDFSIKLGYLDSETAKQLKIRQDDCIRLLQALINSHRKAAKSEA